MLDAREIYGLTDVKAEVVIAEFQEKNAEVQQTQVLLNPIGAFNKSQRQDISDIVEKENDFGSSSIHVNVVRAGLYDALPDGLMHVRSETKLGSETPEKDQLIEHLQQVKREEQEARRFFLPFDQNINTYRLLIESEERRVLTGFPVGSRHTLFDIIWGGLEDNMSNYQKSVLFSLLPMSYNHSGNLEFISLAFEAITGFKTKVSKQLKTTTLPSEDLTTSLGEQSLSLDLILGESSHTTETICFVVIGPISTDHVISYLPRGSSTKIVKTLCNFFIPSDMEIEVEYHFETNQLQLNHEDQLKSAENRLGYNVTI